MRKAGNYSLTELTSTVDGHTAFVVTDPDSAGSWERAQVVPSADIQWTADDHDADDLELEITVTAFASLVAKGREHCPSCTGCTR